MSKLLVVLVCLCVYAAIGAVVRHIDDPSQINMSASMSNVSRVEQASGSKVYGYTGAACNGRTLKKV